MTAYLAWWLAGGAAGIAAGLLVLRRRDALSTVTAVTFLAAAIGCFYGAKLQYRLRFSPLFEAALFGPRELLVPGLHIPLGLVMGFGAAMVAAALLRAPLLQVADALAVGAAVMMPLGRVGCLLTGCCTGTVCPAWLHRVCVPGTGTTMLYGEHQAPQLLPTGAPVVPLSHPLPLYFALLGLGLLAVYLWLLRRGARPGTLVATGFLVYPLGQLGIEQLRDASADRGPVMTAVLLGMIAADALVLAARHLARRRAATARATVDYAPRGGSPTKATALLPLLVVVLWAPHASGEEPTEREIRWQSTLQRYAQDPLANRRALLALARTEIAPLPPVYRLAVADAYLRSGRLRAAARHFDDVLGAEPGEPWTSLAALGRGWTAVRRGDLDAARGFFLDATAAPGSTGLLGDLMVGLIDAGDGATGDALERFARIAEDPDAPDHLRLAVRMGEGYTRFWTGDDAGARAAFAEIADRAPDGPLADDARYAAALVRWRQGDRAGAAETLRTLAGSARGPRSGPASSALADLDPRGLVRASARRYRRLPLRMPADQVLAMLDVDAPAVARIALRRLDDGGTAPPPIGTRTSAGGQRPHDGETVPGAAPAPAEGEPHTRAPRPATGSPRSSGVSWVAIVWLALGTAAALWLATASRRVETRR